MAESKTNCCLKSCQHSSKVVDSETDRARVKAYPVKESEKKGLHVDWQPDGKALFHLDCWQQLVEAAKCEEDTELKLGGREADMVKEASKTAEYHYSDSHVTAEAARIARILQTSKYCIAFTGAGISTAAGIGDFRGIEGKWTNRDKQKKYGKDAGSSGAGAQNRNRTNYRPTYTHEALVKLVEMGLLKFIISQNTDGLHRLSGVPQEKLAELHGNSFQEKCEQCGHRYDRVPGSHASNTKVPVKKCSRCHINHRTGGVCSQPGCKGYLMNTIINFGDYLEEEVLGKAQQEARKNDAVLCLGSTLQVSPANDLVVQSMPPRLLICNRQRTPYDDLAVIKGPDGEEFGSRVFGDCDLLMQSVMKHILPPEELTKWEGERGVRMAQYDLMRQAIQK